jgi:eukaryotic-like serine/threonine-protein kinase
MQTEPIGGETTNTYKCMGNYRIIRRLGCGGSAVVLLGCHLDSGREVAIKVPHLQATDAVDKLRREARLLANLRHPHIIRAHEFGIDEGNPFLVLDYASAGDLSQRYGQNVPVPLSEVVFFAKQVASALQHMHSAGFLHRDIKPANMLLLRPDHLVLSDFDIAIDERLVPVEEKRPGTIRYMAPEQLNGSACQASDQYALAVVVYEWLCAKAPFGGMPLRVMHQHLYASPPHLPKHIIAVPVNVDEVLQKALAKDPADRFSNIHEFSLALSKAATSINFYF